MTTIRFKLPNLNSPWLIVHWHTVPRVGESVEVNGSLRRVTLVLWSVEGVATVVLGD